MSNEEVLKPEVNEEVMEVEVSEEKLEKVSGGARLLAETDTMSAAMARGK